MVPRLWGVLGRRLGDVAERLESDRQVSVFLGRSEEIFTEFVGVVVPEHAATPDGMVRIDVPAGRYATTHHVGQDVQGSYRRIFDWAAQPGLVLRPHERAHHHLEWYREPVLQGELEFDIWVRLQSVNP
jgi:predicted transcriptional regulator YdeE